MCLVTEGQASAQKALAKALIELKTAFLQGAEEGRSSSRLSFPGGAGGYGEAADGRVCGVPAALA